MEYIIFIGSIIAVCIIAKILSWPFKLVLKLLLNILIGIILIVVVNIIGQSIGLHIAFNTVTALVSGTLGIPGVILLIIFSYIL